MSTLVTGVQTALESRALECNSATEGSRTVKRIDVSGVLLEPQQVAPRMGWKFVWADVPPEAECSL